MSSKSYNKGRGNVATKVTADDTASTDDVTAEVTDTDTASTDDTDTATAEVTDTATASTDDTDTDTDTASAAYVVDASDPDGAASATPPTPTAPAAPAKVSAADRRAAADAALAASIDAATVAYGAASIDPENADRPALAALFAAIPNGDGAGTLDHVNGAIVSALFVPSVDADGNVTMPDMAANGLRAVALTALRTELHVLLAALGARPNGVDPIAARRAAVDVAGRLTATAVTFAACAEAMTERAANAVALLDVVTDEESAAMAACETSSAVRTLIERAMAAADRNVTAHTANGTRATPIAPDYVAGSEYFHRDDDGVIHRAIVDADLSWIVTSGRSGAQYRGVVSKRANGTPASGAAKLVNGGTETSGPKYWFPIAEMTDADRAFAMPTAVPTAIPTATATPAEATAAA